ncbi:hypothetical protein A3C23_02260 [Candidatus Roizmanbacteria bacterium RIFCSPHIGHO2_02_FULL_37_13b]|uniref:Transcriptional repressor n=1 Tax=Candidatus Roizmanbacteria bacterium RIFCSPLOWO2_02_FULL_36_11 TaxID=1802071 RepID=A0A1F7JGK4_9BACT|nr:MAG: hypothetical protein A3C23_02260 [Candidatus Roizmanbacteria bacterium RIFCSPHIGHO2_02_FULL_37_13b]OGK54749.1 MAG: hypothetical protein A3H78_05670 [Candidatus Roizmanbacteria bacterium RIFCSPLOWO2_02_FULL_36_11]
MTKIGYRFTRPRRLIFEVLEQHIKPVSTQDIFQFLKKRNKYIDLTSIYRTLDLMKKATIVNEIEFGDGKKRYELVKGKNHHHHLVCKNCGDVEDIEIREEKLMKALKIETDFKIEKHTLEFFGLCDKCK